VAKDSIKRPDRKDYQLLDNGVIAVARHHANFLEPYREVNKVPDYLSLIDHSLALNKERYERLLKLAEVEFHAQVRKLQTARKFLIIVFQGRDASGKSGATERIIQAVDYDPRIFMWVPIGAPTEDEKQHPYLWRFMTGERMPGYGQVRVFDRSWAERVLVEPVMKLTPPKEVARSYTEIRAFEWLLNSQGAVLVKFWMDITKGEQLKRFKARQEKKPWKIGEDDQKARKNWNSYSAAANEMFYRTGTDMAPWYLVSSEDKSYSRVSVLQVLNQELKAAL